MPDTYSSKKWIVPNNIDSLGLGSVLNALESIKSLQTAISGLDIYEAIPKVSFNPFPPETLSPLVETISRNIPWQSTFSNIVTEAFFDKSFKNAQGTLMNAFDGALSGIKKDFLERAAFHNPVQKNFTAYERFADYSRTSSMAPKNIFVDVAIDIDSAATQTLLQSISQDDFSAGEISNTEKYIVSVAEEWGWGETLDWLRSVCLKNFGSSQVIIGVLHSLSHYDYGTINPKGVYIALGVLQHKDVYVRDCAIRAFENWNCKKAITVLKALNCDAKWQQDYIDSVIRGLEAEGTE